MTRHTWRPGDAIDPGAVPELPDDETTAALLRQSMKPKEISSEKQGARVDELVRWMGAARERARRAGS